MAGAIDNTQALEFLEAYARYAMHEHAAIEPRGYDSARRRAEIHADIDATLDKIAEYKALA
ncbi:MAG: hypothetical protein CMJ18_07680 [Phycisphaeraceae bacterium]|nr:hypothetical protein [Phycisphaeraceae bacterium]